MSLSSSFDVLSFQRKVQDALQSVERALELERKPRLAADVDHTYGAKYGLVDLTSNAAIIAYMNCFEKLGLDAAVLKSIDKTKPATLRFETSTSYKFLKEVKVDVPMDRSYEEKEETVESDPSKKTTKTKVMKAIHHITEFHWEVEVKWSISIYSGTSVGDKKVIKSRKCNTQVITQTKERLGTTNLPPIELPLTWLLQQIDMAGLASQFKVDIEDDKTKTPRRNDAVEQALCFGSQLKQWCTGIQSSFTGHLQRHVLQKHNPALPKPQSFTAGQLLAVKGQYSIFNPVLPLMEESEHSVEDDGSNDIESKSVIGLQCTNTKNDDNKSLLTSRDISKLLNEHVRTLDDAVNGIEKSWPANDSDNILSSAEATLSLLSSHLINLSFQYTNTMSYIESMMEKQLVAAIGKRLTPKDLDKFVKFHYARLLRPIPQPFSHAIRRPEHYPVGLLSIESEDEESECIHSHSREVNPTANLKIPLSAATVLELTGQQYLHGYMNHRFGASHKRHQLVARARQFSAFVLVIGNMADGTTLDPKDAIIVQNKDELLIPLLLDELPTAKEFKDAVKSLSPEQQRFACAYRKMQLASSVFGICVIQIKPQLEALLGLPPDALDKEMKLTQNLMELFIEYQVPSDMLSYNGFSEDVATEDKVSNVRDNVKSVMDVVTAEKEKQLKSEQAKTEMAMGKAFQGAVQQQMGTRQRGPPANCVGLMVPCSYSVPPAENPHAEMFAMDDRCDVSCERRMLSFDSTDLCEDIMFATELCSIEQESSLSRDVASRTKRGAGELQNSHPKQDEEKRGEKSSENGQSSKAMSDQGVDFTLIPQILDAAVEKSGEGNALRSTTIKTGENWVRNRQENLLTAPKRQRLDVEEVKKEKNKAFDLLDALSRSGSLPIAYSDLHVVVAVTHCFDKDVMSTVVCDNINPIEKLECSTLLFASAVHGVPARDLIGNTGELQCLEGALPLLLQPSEHNDHGNDDGAQS